MDGLNQLALRGLVLSSDLWMSATQQFQIQCNPLYMPVAAWLCMELVHVQQRGAPL